MAAGVEPRTPCIIGVAQHTARGGAPEPLDTWEQVARSAAADAGAPAAVERLDSIQVVYSQSWQYDDPPGRLAARLGAEAGHRVYSGIGGTTPQLLVHDACDLIERGDADLALVVGAEALATRRALKKAGEKPAWTHRHPGNPPFPFDDPFHPSELAHQLFEAWLTFAVFDIARRAHTGVAPDDHRRAIGELFAPMTEVAAHNSQAWFPVARTAAELMGVTADNRMVGYPYTKWTVSVMDVDMGAAVLIASTEQADALGVADERRVYLRGHAYASDPVYVAERPELWRSPGMAEAGRAALAAAGVGIDDIAHLDLYSCFASSVEFARDALGIASSDHRSLTATGGLPFHGGPGSGYMTHAIAAVVAKVRNDPGSFGMVSGVGMHMQKHVFGVYSSEPGEPDVGARPRPSEPVERRPIEASYEGQAAVAAYSVVHGRGGAAESGLAVCDLPGGARAYARFDDPDLLAEAEQTELVGAAVTLASRDGVNRLTR